MSQVEVLAPGDEFVDIDTTVESQILMPGTEFFDQTGAGASPAGPVKIVVFVVC
jgi:hypothetical protein